MNKQFQRLLPLLGLMLACAAGPAPSPPLSGDIVELRSPSALLSPGEQDSLASAGVRHLAIPLGMADAPARPELPARLTGGIIPKVVVPETQRPLLADEAYRRRLFASVQEWILAAERAETSVEAVLFHFEGAACPAKVEGVSALKEALRPLRVACGAGVPAFWVSAQMGEVFEAFDFVVVFGQGCAWPPSGDPALVDGYRGQSHENKPAEPSLPHYQAVSLANTSWVTWAAGGVSVVSGIELGTLDRRAGVRAAGQIMDTPLVDPQYAYEMGRSLTLTGLTLERGDKITVALANYPFRRAAFGAWARRPAPGYLGRYLLPYTPGGGGGVIGFGTLADYLSGVVDGPVPVVEVLPSGRGHVLALTNASGLYSDLSDTGNYIEWFLPRGRLGDASIGEFARFRFLDGETEEMPGRAASIRFYESYLAPYETVRTGPILLNGPPAGTVVVRLALPGGEALETRFPTR